MDMKKISIYMFSIAFLLFCFCITALSLLLPSIWQKNPDSPFQFVIGNQFISFGQAMSLLLFAVITVLFYLALYRFFSRLSNKWLKWIAAGLFFMIICMETVIIILFHDMLPPQFDSGHVYVIALHMIKHGTLPADQFYLQIYPNNLPITVARYLLYRFAAFGNPAHFMLVEKLASAICLNIGIYFSWLLMVKLFNHKMGNLLLILTMNCFPLFLYIPYFYTESLALMFPSMLVYLCYRYFRTKQVIYLLILGAAFAIACQIRENMLLFAPALFIFMLYVLRLKNVLICALMILLTFLPVTFGAQAYYKHLGYQPDNSVKAPVTHWIALGLSYHGRYNTPDTLLSVSKPTQQAKKRADLALIKKRIKEKGPSGLVKQWGIKAARTFAMGDMSYPGHGYPPHFTTAYRYIFDGHKQVLKFTIQFLHIAALFLLTLSSLRFLRVKKYDINLLIQICLFGSFLFFTVLWEAEPRYSLLFMPLTLIGAVYGLKELHVLMAKKRSQTATIWSGQTIRNMMLAVCLLAALLYCAKLNMKNLTDTPIHYQDYVVDQYRTKGIHYALVDSGHVAAQTFTADKAFDRIAFKPANYKGEATYRLSLFVQSGKKEKKVYEEVFSPNKETVKGFNAFTLKKPLPGGGRHYRMLISKVSGSKASRLSLHVYGVGGLYEQQDMYNNGQFFQNGKAIPRTDLTFKISKERTEPYMRRSSYYGLFIIPALMIVFYAYTALPPSRSQRVRKPLNEFGSS
ncbi:glycosyltransferase family 39 protein [Heyndrickxia acidiproducens]|uniref:glycosyltransferase family 39 protein n=1 Tax=Heyndrickxia acidiproducens TaxID=1121084 RepID=UPI00047775F4|nr:glycosyltransferase family 39 protein [Heyndrickxia acidiproducens]